MISESIKYIGVNDHEIDLFEGQYVVPFGMSYNSYVIIDEKIAVLDTVDRAFTGEWLGNLEAVLGGKTPDYLIVHHMEPDHSASITAFTDKYPGAKICSSKAALQMMKNFYGKDYTENHLMLTEGTELDLGRHSLSFITAPMVHWPEVVMSYERSEGMLFSADGFGKFGALDYEDEWACEARRYYFGIVGKYGQQVQAVLKKAAALDIKKICPLHGPVLDENIGYYIDLYDVWSSYRPEDEGVAIAYTSVYGNTETAVELLKEELEKLGVRVSVTDLARGDMAEAVEDAFRYDRLVLATTTYNNTIFPHMREFINHLTERGYKNRRIGLIENGSWAPVAAKTMRAMLEECEGIEYTDTTVRILSAMNDTSKEAIINLAKELATN